MLASCDPPPSSRSAFASHTDSPPEPMWRGDPPQEPPPPARFADPALGRYHMRRHFEDLRMVEELLIAGKLDEATALATLLVGKVADPGLARWRRHDEEVSAAAQALAQAPSVDEALRRAPRVAAACAGCHAEAQVMPRVVAAPAVPADDQTPRARMARHAWAVDRLWEGLVMPSDDRWSRGLTVLAQSPPPFTALSDAPQLAGHLQEVARRQLALRATTDLDDRGVAYGELLVTCAACHASLHVALR
jgi:cytochrome c553